MALNAVLVRRAKSTTVNSRGLSANENASPTALLCRQIAAAHANTNDDSGASFASSTSELRKELLASAFSKDVFRRASGFEHVITLLETICTEADSRDSESLESVVVQVSSLLRLLSAALHDHIGNTRYWNRVDGWTLMRESLLALYQTLCEGDDDDLQLQARAALISSVIRLALGEDDGTRLGDRLRQCIDPLAEDSQASDTDVPSMLQGHETIAYNQPWALVTLMVLQSLDQPVYCSRMGSTIVSQRVCSLISAITNFSTRNKVALWESGVSSDLLKRLLDTTWERREAVSEFFQLLAPYGLSNLNDAELLFRKASESDEARTLLLDLLRASKGPAFIQFDLSQSGFSSVELQSLPRAFPPTAGYSLTAWMRFDQFDAKSHTTLFGTMDSTQTCFILAYLEQDTQSLILQTSVRSSRPSVRFKSTRFALDQWYHIAIVHRKANSDPRQSPVMLFIDGEFVEQVKIGYPEPPPDHDERQNGRSSMPSQRAVQAFFGTPHDLAPRLGRNELHCKWSLASAHLYATPLSDESVAIHHKLGPRYYGNMQDCLGPLLTYRASAELNRYNELLHPEKTEKSDILAATVGRGSDVIPEGRILLSISPVAVLLLDGLTASAAAAKYDLNAKAKGRYQTWAQNAKAIAINTAIPTINEAIARSYGSAILTGDPVVVSPRSLDDAAWCLGGSLSAVVKILESASSKAAFLQAVQIMFDCIQDSWRISEGMEASQGFGVLALIIRERLGFESGASSSNAAPRKPSPMLPLEDRQTLPLELLQLILAFVGYDQTSPEKSMVVNAMAYRVLLIDFDTWRRCDHETQKLYYTQFGHFVTRNVHHGFNHKKLVVRMRVTKKLIDSLKVDDYAEESVPLVMTALMALLDSGAAHNFYRDLAMFVVFGLQDERAQQAKPLHSMLSVVKLRQRAVSWARRSRPNTQGGASPGLEQAVVSRSELAVNVSHLLTDMLCDEQNLTAPRRFAKAMPARWLLHLLAEPDFRVVICAVRIICRSLVALGADFKTGFVDRNGGFTTLKARMKVHWRSAQLWTLGFAMLFGRDVSNRVIAKDLTVFGLVDILQVGDNTRALNPEMLQPLMAMLEAALRDVVKTDDPREEDARLVKTVIQFLSELHSRSAFFRDFAAESRYVQELLFVLYPVVVGSDRLSAGTELSAEHGSLSFRGEEVVMRPHSNSIGGKAPSVRSLNMDDDRRTPSPAQRKRVTAPRRLSSFILVNDNGSKLNVPSSKFEPSMAPRATLPPKLNVSNTIVESLLEACVGLFVDLICNKKDFAGIGLFLKTPPGFREHQAYFESYVLVHTLSQLWNHLQLNKSLLEETRVLMNLGKFCLHMAEAVFEGWFIDGAQPLIQFIGQMLDYLQSPDVASIKSVRLCAQATTTMRLVFLRVTLLRLSELDETTDPAGTVAFLKQMSYWQTILFSAENQETSFTKLISYLLYMKLTSTDDSVRHVAADLWRTMMMQKPTETATLVTSAMGSEQRHLSTGFMQLVQQNDEDFVTWIDQNRQNLDTIFVYALAKPWDDFVNDENRRNEESAKARLNKRRDKLRQWQNEETSTDDLLNRYETSTNHWRVNIHAQERLKLQRSTQDHQESANQLFSVFARQDQLRRQPGGLDAEDRPKRWQLDETEGINRMRLRTLPDLTIDREVYQPKRKFSQRNGPGKLAIDTHIAHAMKDDILTPIPVTPTTPMDGISEDHEVDTHPRRESASSSQLLEGGFEIIEDPQEGEDGTVEDKNRKVMTSLARGDMVQQLYNVSRIVGLEACEGLLVIGKKCLYLQDNFFTRSDGEIVSVSQAPEDEKDPYVQLISGKDIGAARTRNSIGNTASRQWKWAEVLSISKRRFLFRDVSLEVFFSDGRSYMVTCMTSKKRDELYSAIAHRAPQVHSASTMASEDTWRLDNLRSPEETPQTIGSRFANVFSNPSSSTATKSWIRGEMSNFQYLMLINTMAGRSFNDLTQYPVFPWVLADYSSEELDLTDPKAFRDLSKPMGCQTPAREADFRDRYQQFAEMGDENAPPFNYGTHYSSAMIVTSYLIRLQPFVQSYLLLQGGNFDHADRLFDSVERAWLSSSRENMTDVRELTPEFYYLPEFLSNTNGYDFGTKQGDAEVVNDVKLPPWAKGDPHLFITKHREALESAYVNEHLHKWIDLVFGHKQRGEAAVEATNVFQHLSYGGAKDLDAIQDPVERLATIGIIHSFGQTPHQVFQRPHPGRELEKSVATRLDTMAESLTRLPSPLLQSDEKISSLLFLTSQDRLLCAGPAKLNMLPNCDRYMQWGFADNSIRFFSSNTKRLLGLNENTHIGAIQTAIFADSKTLVLGGADCTLSVWSVSSSRDSIEIASKAYLFGHRSPVNVIVASRVFSTLLSASSDGQVLLWDLNRHDCIRVLLAPGRQAIQAAHISNTSGHIALCRGTNMLLYTLNGHLLVDQKICESPDDMLCCAFYSGAGNEWMERELVFTGHAHGVVNVWALTALSDGAWHMSLVNRLNHVDMNSEDGGNGSAGITAVLPMPNAVYTGDEDGKVWEWDILHRQSGHGARGR